MPLPTTKAPALSFPLHGDGAFDLAQSTPQHFTIVVFYRGTHCPICKTYLSEIDSMLDTAAEQGIEVVAVSMDTPERTTKTVTEADITQLRIGHSLSQETVRAWDLYVSEARQGSTEPAIFSEPGLFVIASDGTIFFAQTQSAPFTRPDFKKLLGGLKFVVEKSYPARGGALALAAG